MKTKLQEQFRINTWQCKRDAGEFIVLMHIDTNTAKRFQHVSSRVVHGQSWQAVLAPYLVVFQGRSSSRPHPPTGTNTSRPRGRQRSRSSRAFVAPLDPPPIDGAPASGSSSSSCTRTEANKCKVSYRVLCRAEGRRVNVGPAVRCGLRATED